MPVRKYIDEKQKQSILLALEYTKNVRKASKVIFGSPDILERRLKNSKLLLEPTKWEFRKLENQ